MPLQKAKLVLHHDDPPCKARLASDGFCEPCDLFPDTQSTAFRYYCPSCVPLTLLKNLRCPHCATFFQKPN